MALEKWSLFEKKNGRCFKENENTLRWKEKCSPITEILFLKHSKTLTRKVYVKMTDLSTEKKESLGAST